MFHYGPKLVGNISSAIKKHHIKTGNFKINASEMKTFLHIILLLIGDLIDENDAVYTFLIIFIRIENLIKEEEFNDEKLQLLGDLISKHHELYIHLFKDTLKPKHHFMVHYAMVIKKLGPLKHLWNFRFEGKHQVSKQYSHVITSRKNIPLSLVIKHSLYFSHCLVENVFCACYFSDLKKNRD